MDNKFYFSASDEHQGVNVAKDILKLLIKYQDYKYILMVGDLGAGKTTLVKNILAIMGSNDVVSSPTFSIHNTYSDNIGRILLHSDLYRLDSMVELENTGFFELVQECDFAFIEWADRFELKDMLERYIEIGIIKKPDGDTRTGREYIVTVYHGE